MIDPTLPFCGLKTVTQCEKINGGGRRRIGGSPGVRFLGIGRDDDPQGGSRGEVNGSRGGGEERAAHESERRLWRRRAAKGETM